VSPGLFKYASTEIIGKEGGHRLHLWTTLAIAFEVLHGKELIQFKLQQIKRMYLLGMPNSAGYLLPLNGRNS